MRLLLVSMSYVLIIVLSMITQSGHALYFGNDMTVTNHTELPSSSLTSSSKQLAATEKGDVYVVWVDKNNKTGDTDVIFRSSNDSGMNFDDRKKLTGRKPISFSPQLAATEKGDVYEVWVDNNNKTRDTDITFSSSIDI